MAYNKILAKKKALKNLKRRIILLEKAGAGNQVMVMKQSVLKLVKEMKEIGS